MNVAGFICESSFVCKTIIYRYITVIVGKISVICYVIGIDVTCASSFSVIKKSVVSKIVNRIIGSTEIIFVIEFTTDFINDCVGSDCVNIIQYSVICKCIAYIKLSFVRKRTCIVHIVIRRRIGYSVGYILALRNCQIVCENCVCRHCTHECRNTD